MGSHACQAVGLNVGWRHIQSPSALGVVSAVAKIKTASAKTDAEIPVVGGREPCPCGSGKRYKACHGLDAARAAKRVVTRPFEGLPSETDWVAMREFVPAATAPLTLKAKYAEDGQEVIVASVLPMAWPALKRDTGAVLVAMQTLTSSNDPSRDIAGSLLAALANAPGHPVETVPPDAASGPRLQDVVNLRSPFELTVHESFDFWVEGAEDATGELAASLERAKQGATPTVKLPGVTSAYWSVAPSRNHVRWVMSHPEGALTDALARLQAAGELNLGDGTRYAGSFRALGLMVPVWDLPSDVTAPEIEGEVLGFEKRLNHALAVEEPLDSAERRARDGLLNRQVTLR